MSNKKSSGNMFTGIWNFLKILYRILSALILYTERFVRHVLNHGRWAFNTGPGTHARLCVWHTNITGSTPGGFVIVVNWLAVVILHLVAFIILVCWSFIRALVAH